MNLRAEIISLANLPTYKAKNWKREGGNQLADLLLPSFSRATSLSAQSRSSPRRRSRTARFPNGFVSGLAIRL